MPITGVLVTCRDGEVENARRAIQARSHLEVGEGKGNMLVVVTDTATLAEDKTEIDWLSSLPGVASALITYTNLEDIAKGFKTSGEHS